MTEDNRREAFEAGHKGAWNLNPFPLGTSNNGEWNECYRRGEIAFRESHTTDVEQCQESGNQGI